MRVKDQQVEWGEGIFRSGGLCRKGVWADMWIQESAANWV